jgi:hypothetical protein
MIPAMMASTPVTIMEVDMDLNTGRFPFDRLHHS